MTIIASLLFDLGNSPIVLILISYYMSELQILNYIYFPFYFIFSFFLFFVFILLRVRMECDVTCHIVLSQDNVI